MANDNHVMIVGNLTDDPEIRFTPSGAPVASVRIAYNPRKPDGSGGWTAGEPSFFRVNVWRDQAENAGDSLHKGDRVIVSGRLRSRSWDTPEGEKRFAVEIEADEIGPALRWATTEVTRKSGGNGGGKGKYEDKTDPGAWNEPPPF